MNFLTLAAKNLTRRRGRTGLTVIGVAIAISVLFSLLALNSGYEKELNKEVNSMGVHILAVPKGCPYEAASLIIHGGVIPKYLSATDLENVTKIPDVELATPMLLHQFLKTDEKTGKSTPHIIYGIEIKEMLQLKSVNPGRIGDLDVIMVVVIVEFIDDPDPEWVGIAE